MPVESLKDDFVEAGETLGGLVFGIGGASDSVLMVIGTEYFDAGG